MMMCDIGKSAYVVNVCVGGWGGGFTKQTQTEEFMKIVD